MRKLAILLGAATLAACGPTSDELRLVPPVFTVAVPDYWDRIATCLIDAYSSSGFLIPDNKPVPGEQRTELYLQIRGHLGQVINVAMFDIRGKGRERDSTVAFRRRPPAISLSTETEDTARARVERCKTAPKA